MKGWNKLKNFFLNDEEIDETKEEQIKEEQQIESQPIPSIKKEEPIQIENTFKFPAAFDNDFENSKTREIKRIEPVERKFKMPEPPKKEKKVFTPSPIISPVYGVLDKNYKKGDIKEVKDGLIEDIDETKDKIDFVRSKIYENPMSREKRLYEQKEESPEPEKEMELNLFFSEKTEIETKMEQLEQESKELDKKINNIEELLKESNDEDLYSLIDEMYKDTDLREEE